MVINKNFQTPRRNCINKKSQMKIQQMSFMLLAVFLFFALVGMIVLKISVSGLKQSAEDLREQNAFLLVTKLANSPEFSCGGAYGIQKTNCVDEDKIMALKENIDKYKNFWGVLGIEIRRIYPENKNIICTPEKYPNCDIIKLIDSSKPSKSNFVALCRKEKYNGEIANKCEMAELIVRYD